MLVESKYQNYNAQVVLSTLYEQDLLLSSEINSSTVEEFLQHNNAVTSIGRGLYPRFYTSGEGHPDPSWSSYKPREYDRLGFILLGSERQSVLFRTQNPPAYFPNAADILVIGCNQKEYIDAYMIIFLDSSNEVLMRASPQNWVCSQ